MLLNRNLFIGFDGGGTKTVCVIGDSEGNLLALATGASTNLKSRPQESVKEVIFELLAKVIESQEVNKSEIKGVFISTAGGDREEDQQRWKQWVRDFGIKTTQIVVKNDAVGALAAGTMAKEGVVLIAGTGSIAYSVENGNAQPARVGGWGYLFGDEGSGYDIGNQALRIIARSHDGRDEKKERLSEYILERCNLQRPEQLITFVYEDPYPRKLIASIAKHVLALAERGEPIAERIISEAIHDLIELIIPIIPENKVVPIILSGGLFHSLYYRTKFEQTLRKTGLDLPIILPNYPPVVGSYICALLDNKKVITSDVEQNITDSWERALGMCEKFGGRKDEWT